jgi:DVNP family
MKKHIRLSDGFYHINGKKYKDLIGTRACVYHETAYKTSGGLTKEDLELNKHGRIVSKKLATLAVEQNHLGDHKQPKESKEFGSLKSMKRKRSSKHKSQKPSTKKSKR